MKINDKKALERYQKKLSLIRNSAQVTDLETLEQKVSRMERLKKDIPAAVEYYFPHYAKAKSANFHIDFFNKVKKDETFTGFAKWGRGLAKSVWNNVIIPFLLWWLSGQKFYLVIISISEKRAVRLLEDLRAEFEANPRIIADFGEQKSEGHWEKELWISQGGFIGQALGFGQSCRGLRVNEIRPNHYSVDDIETRLTIKNDERQKEMVEWVESELLPSMDGDVERLVFSNNWFAEEMFLTKLSTLHPDWLVHEVKAYNPITYEPAWPAKYKWDYYIKKEKKMGIEAALAEYNHDARPKGKTFKPKMIQWAKIPALNHFKIIVAHWDVAYTANETSDYNAVRIWGLYKDNFYYITSFVAQCEMADAIRFMCYHQKGLPESVTIHWQYEAQFWNVELKRTLKEVKKETKVNLLINQVPTPKKKKWDRILTLLPRYQNERMYYNERMKSHKSTQLANKLLFKLEGKTNEKDDPADADVQCIEFLEKYISIDVETSANDFQSGSMLPNNERI